MTRGDERDDLYELVHEYLHRRGYDLSNDTTAALVVDTVDFIFEHVITGEPPS